MARMTAEEMDALNLSDSQWDALYYVARLVAAQNAKWGEQNHHDAVWLAINLEEIGEAADACPMHSYEEERAVGHHRTELVDCLTIDGYAIGQQARRAVETYFETPATKSRVNGESHPPDLDKEIGQTASVAIDWLASRWRKGL